MKLLITGIFLLVIWIGVFIVYSKPVSINSNFESSKEVISNEIIEKQSPKKSKLLNTIALSAETMTSEEEQALLDYLRFLRHKKNA